MGRKLLIFLAIAIGVPIALAPPALGASWTHNHEPLNQPPSSPQETFTGTAQFQGLVGKVHCADIETQVQLLDGTSEGIVTSFTSLNPAACHVSGALGTSCGTNSLAKVELTKAATATIVTSPAGTDAITIEDLQIFYEFKSGGKLCMTTETSSDPTRDVRATPDDPQTLSTLTLSGTLATASGNVSISGTLHAEEPKTFGIDADEGFWTHNHEPLNQPPSSPQETFTGTAQFQGLVGKVHCADIETQVQLLDGTSEGIVTSFTSLNPAACHVSGALGTSCGTNSLAKVELTKAATATIVTSPAGTDAITIEDLQIFYEFKSGGKLCMTTETSSDPTRDVRATPDDPQTLSTLTLSGTLATASGNVSISGTLHAEEPKTFGIDAD
jgi:hypothetical protein